jgi:hypothetical protein
MKRQFREKQLYNKKIITNARKLNKLVNLLSNLADEHQNHVSLNYSSLMNIEAFWQGLETQ